MSASGVWMLDYANGLRGRIFDLPPAYQDMIAAAARTLHPKTVTREMQRLMASDGYLRSNHPLIRDLDGDGLAEFHRQLATRRVVPDGAG